MRKDRTGCCARCRRTGVTVVVVTIESASGAGGRLWVCRPCYGVMT